MDETRSTYKYAVEVGFGDDSGEVAIAVYGDDSGEVGIVLGYGLNHNSILPVTAAKVGALITRNALKEHYGDEGADDALADLDVVIRHTGEHGYRPGCTCVAGCAMCDMTTPSRDGRDKDGNQIDNPLALTALPRKALEIINRLAALKGSTISSPMSDEQFRSYRAYQIGILNLMEEASDLAEYISKKQLAL